MTITNGYTDLETVKGYLSISDTADDFELERAVESASRAIDDYCRRRFWQDTDATTVVYYDPPRQGRLWLSQQGPDWADLTTLTSLETDHGNDDTYENTWTTSDYLLGPYNAAAASEPYRWVERRVGGAYSWPAYDKSIKITGQFGWPSVPTVVVQATIMLADRFFQAAKDAGPHVDFGFDSPTVIQPNLYLPNDLLKRLNVYRSGWPAVA